MSKPQSTPQLIICMGVSASGKTTLACELSQRLDMTFLDADDFHSDENKQHMASGLPLTDAMRAPWIATMCSYLAECYRDGKDVVLAYSGLRRVHREQFRALDYKPVFLYLHGTREVIGERLKNRSGHFMPEVLLESQFSALEDPRGEPGVFTIEINQPVPAIIDDALRAVGKSEEAKR